jgi:hypothetical protein
VTWLLARLLRATRLVDLAFRRFEAIRLELVLALASDAVLAKFNDLAYSRTDAYHPHSSRYRSRLYEWEQAALAAHFPAPPARLLIGAAGGGREAFALAEHGYAITAFEPSPLAALMAGARPNGTDVTVYRARYSDLPAAHTLDGSVVDLSTQARFEGGILGWASFSHLPSDAERVTALRNVAALVDGPVLVSYFGWVRPEKPPAPTGLRRLVLRWVGERRPGSLFSIDVGLYRQLTEQDVRSLAAAAGLRVLAIDMAAQWPNAVLRRAS